MFRCDSCKSVSQPGESPTRVTVETRAKVYYPRFRETVNPYFPDQVLDRGGYGWEIARELRCCRNCIESQKVVASEPTVAFGPPHLPDDEE